jgi:Protein of unknown function (DUF1569)
MNSLIDDGAIESIVTRLGKLHPERPRAWGRMTPNEMVCHFTDSFAIALGERPFTPADTWMQRTVVKYVALRTSLAWPQGLKTRPEVEQGAGGTRPADFEADRARAVAILRRFAAPDTHHAAAHPLFGLLNRDEWMIWGYRHTDHHLRQFAL